jgi:DNA-binding NarL/FixJ family response regulator
MRIAVTEARTIRVLIVEDHPIVGLRHVLEHEGMQVCGEVQSIEGAIQSVALTGPDLVTIDLSLGGEDGLDLVRRLSVERPRLPVLVYSMFEDAAHIGWALRAGAKGYITKGETFDVMPLAIRSCLAGNRYLSPISERSWLNSAEIRKALEALSAQEQQVYTLLGQGFSNAAIADGMHVSPRTVESYLARIQVKLGLTGMKELRQQAVANPI